MIGTSFRFPDATAKVETIKVTELSTMSRRVKVFIRTKCHGQMLAFS
jgi:hypothetical protein